MTTTKIKNTWRKTKPLGESYVTLTDHRCGYIYKVRKLYTDPRKPFARAFCSVVSDATIGEHGDLGDVYCNEIPGLIAAWLKAHTPTDTCFRCYESGCTAHKNTDPIIIDHGERTWDGTYPEDN